MHIGLYIEVNKWRTSWTFAFQLYRLFHPKDHQQLKCILLQTNNASWALSVMAGYHNNPPTDLGIYIICIYICRCVHKDSRCDRYNTSSFRNEQYRNATTLSNYIWTLKDKNINYSPKWKIIDRGRAYQPSGKNCGLCDLEKFYIISRPELASLNQRNELATSCRHRKKHLLCNK